MKYSIIKITIICFLTLFMSVEFGYAGDPIITIPEESLKTIQEVSIQPSYAKTPADISSFTIINHVESLGFTLLKILKLLLQGVMLIYMVYIGVSMVISMGHDEDKLTKAKSQIWYTLIALVFINIPGSIYEAINGGSTSRSLNGKTLKDSEFSNPSNDNFFISDTFLAETGVIYNLIGFLEVMIFAVAIFIIMRAGISMMSSAGKEDKLTAARNKIIYSIAAIIFVGFIEAWKGFAIGGTMSKGAEVFGGFTDLALLFAGPVVMVFLTIAGYYYITSAGEEEKVKKAKTILVNTLIAVVLLLVIVTFLNDLTTLDVLKKTP